MPDYVETMAYRNAVPWHGLGNFADDEFIQKIAAMTPEEAAVAWAVHAGIDWPVMTAPIQFEANIIGGQVDLENSALPLGEGLVTHTGHRVMYRQTDGKVLDIVGPRYTPTQNREVVQFFTEYLSATGAGLEIETVGSLDGGKIIWGLAKMNRGFTLPGDDRNEGYVLLANYHQYGKAIVAMFTDVRVVCWNTFQMALSTGEDSLRIWHNQEFDESARAKAREALGLAEEALEEFREVAESLASLTLSDEDAARIAVEFLGTSADKAKIEDGDLDFTDGLDVADEVSKAPRRVLTLYGGEGRGSALESSRGTAWGLFNALTEYTDHEYGRTTDSRMTRSWFGQGNVQKKRFMTRILEEAGTLN
jgi:phage/plasmid-like protein (TIGR03299 family)